MSDNAFIHKEAFWLLAEKELGRGMSRVVYESPLLPHAVIKTEDRRKHFQNVIEWETWERVKDTEFAKWFAPCLQISMCGGVLIQAKTTAPHRFPDKMPAFLCDFKRTNYGMHKGRIVCHDYGTHLMFENGMTKRMRKAEWWDA